MNKRLVRKYTVDGGLSMIRKKSIKDFLYEYTEGDDDIGAYLNINDAVDYAVNFNNDYIKNLKDQLKELKKDFKCSVEAKDTFRAKLIQCREQLKKAEEVIDYYTKSSKHIQNEYCKYDDWLAQKAQEYFKDKKELGI